MAYSICSYTTCSSSLPSREPAFAAVSLAVGRRVIPNRKQASRSRWLIRKHVVVVVVVVVAGPEDRHYCYFGSWGKGRRPRLVRKITTKIAFLNRTSQTCRSLMFPTLFFISLTRTLDLPIAPTR